MSCTFPELPSLKGRRQVAWTRYLESRARHDERHALRMSSSASTPSLPTESTTPAEVLRQELSRHEFVCKPRALAATVASGHVKGVKVGGKSLSSSDPSFQRSTRIRSTSAGGWFGDVTIHSTRRRALRNANQQKSPGGARRIGSSKVASLNDSILSLVLASSEDPQQYAPTTTGLSREAAIDNTLNDSLGMLFTSDESLDEAHIPGDAARQFSSDGILYDGDPASNPTVTVFQPHSPTFADTLQLLQHGAVTDASEDMQASDRSPPKSLRFASESPMLKSAALKSLQPPMKSVAKSSAKLSRLNTDKSLKSTEHDSSSSADEASPRTDRSDDSTTSGGSSPSTSWRRNPIHCDLPAWYPDSISDDDDGSLASWNILPESPVIKCVGSGKIVVQWKLPEQCHCETIWCVRVRQAGDDEWFFVDMDSGRITQERRCGEFISWKNHALISQRGIRVLSYAAVEGDKSSHPYFGTIVAHFPGLVVIDFDPVVAELHTQDWRQIVPQDWVVLAANKVTMKQVLSELLEKQTRVEHERSKALWSIAKGAVYDSIVRARRHCTIVWNFWTPNVDTSSARILASCAMNSEEGSETYAKWPIALAGEHQINARSMDWPTELCCSDTVSVMLEPWPREQIIPRRWICDRLPEAKKASQNACIGQRTLAFYNCSVTGASVESEPLEPPMDNDITLRTATSKKLFVKSERAVFCTLIRAFILPEKVIVQVKRSSGKQFNIPLVSIRKLRYGPKLVKSSYVSEWILIQDQDRGRVSVLARLKDEGPDQLLDEQSKVSCHLPGQSKLTTVTIVKISPRITHYEVVFTTMIPSRKKISPHSLTDYVDENGNRRRLKEPEIVIHDIPDRFTNVEVCVGFSRPPTKEQQHPVWSAPSSPCTVSFQNCPLPVPLGPCFSVIGISVVEATWLLPAEPEVACYRVRFRSAGDQQWSFIDSNGRLREKESALAWRSRLMPLKEGLWVSAFGDYDGRKASTPGPAKVLGVGMRSKSADTVMVAFQKPATVLRLGTAGSKCLTCTQSPQLVDDVQDVPVEWIESAWLLDNHNFLKGSIITKHCRNQPVSLKPAANDASSFHVIVQNDENVMQDIKVGVEYFSQAGRGKGNGRGAFLRRPSKCYTAVQLASLPLHGLQPEARYEVGVQALTTKGWTDWSHREFQMPKTALKQEEIVDEGAKGVLYKSLLLSQAFYKEYSKCWLTLEELLSPDRFARLKAAMQNTFNSERSKLSRWLVDTDGPIRSSRSMHIDEVCTALRSIVSRHADLNYRDQSTGRTPLTYACEYSRFTKIGIVDELLKLRADPDLTNDLNQSPLLIAAERADIRIVKALLDNRADVNLMSRSGITPYIAARASDDMDPVQRSNCPMIREMLRAGRVEWNVFSERISAAASHEEKAEVFLELAFQGNKDIFVTDPDGNKRISRHDRLRLREQIAEAEEISAEEAERRVIFCGRDLLLPQMQASTDAGGQKPSKACSIFTRYLLFSGVMRYVKDEAHAMATSILDHYEKELRVMREDLCLLRNLTEHGEVFAGVAGKKERQKFMGRTLHQWHAHDDLPWLIERNVVVAFEALVHGNAIKEMVDFCYWIGELSAKVHSLNHGSRVYVGAWDRRLPALFWGDVYTRWLLGEAERTAPIFHDIARSIVEKAGGSVEYKAAPNKNYGRVSKKQLEYASFGMLVLHVALDHMHECFQDVFRTDLDAREEYITRMKHVDSKKGAVLILGSLASEDKLHWTRKAVKDVASTQAGPPTLVVFSPDKKFHGDISKEKSQLRACGADAVLVVEFPLDDVMNIRRQMEAALREAYANRRLPEPSIKCVYTVDQLQVLSDIRKCRTKDSYDLYCCGGVLDLVRGSIECSTEEEVKTVYDLATSLRVEEHGAEVVRVKNGFHTPAVGGYCDLKLFLQIAKDCGDTRICHICELQVHLQNFLARKKYTHMPYVIDRGDFDYG